MKRKPLLYGRVPPAFVLNMGANGLGVARTLGRWGVPVVGVDHRPHAAGLASRYVRPLICADISKEPQAVLEVLEEEGCEIGGRAVLLPTSDDAVLFMSRNRSRLAEHYDFLMPSERIEELLVNKRLMYEEATKSGVPMADTYFPRSLDEVDEIASRLAYPVLIKPLYSHLWERIFGNKGFIANSPEELRSRMASVVGSGVEAMVQSILWPPGKDLYSVGAYFGRDGYISSPFCWHKLRQYPPNFGVGSLVESAHQPEVVELGLKLMKALDYRGVGYVEFKRDNRDGKWKMVEINARTGQTNALQEAAGRPLVLVEYLDLIGMPPPDLPDYPDGVLWWDSLNDLDSFWRLRARGELDLKEWMRSWFDAEVFAYYAPGDIGPLLRRFGYGLNLAKAIGNMVKMKVDEDLASQVHLGLPAPTSVVPRADAGIKDLVPREGRAT